MINKTSKQLAITIFSGLVLTLSLQGCASTVLSPVSESKKDSSGQYDGKWHGIVKSTASKQSGGGGWELSCADMAGQNLGTISVANGVATLGKDTAFINQSGQFRFEIPVNEVAAASGTSDATISNGKMTIIMYGSLEKQSGTLTYGIAQFSNNGCSSKVVYKQV